MSDLSKPRHVGMPIARANPKRLAVAWAGMRPGEFSENGPESMMQELLTGRIRLV